MENNDDYKSFKGHNHDTSKRRTPLQLEALEGLYSEDRYPSHKAMEEVALPLKLTYKQVRSWFIERRRKDKRQTSGTKEPPLSSAFNRLTSKRHISLSSFGADDPYDVPGYTNKSIKRGNKSKSKQRATHSQATIRPLNAKDVPGSMLRRNKSNLKHKVSPIQASMRPLNFILKKVFRKDGPPLGVKFDPLPTEAFHHNTTGPTYGPTCARKTTVTKKRKVSDSPISYFEVNTKKKVSVMKHGMGKGLMTVWRATNPGAGSYPTGVNSIGRDITDVHLNSKSAKQTNPPRRKMKKVHHNLATKKGRAGNKFLDRRNCAIRNAKVSNNKPENPKEPHQEECKLALEGLRSQEYRNTITNLVDDEELELRELQTGPNPLTCSAHLAFNGMHSCSLCKDLLARFPPHSIKMKQPLCVQPWGSSIELIKKLFKVFRFLYGHSNTFDICSFTLDEFAQSFHDKDSLLLGNIHLALLKVLFSDVEVELSGEFLPHASKSYRFIGFLHSVKQQQLILKLWSRFLNPMTWTEILRQVLIAAGFNSKQNNFGKEPLNKDDNHLTKYGLRPGTLKGELFSILSEQGNNGLKVSELAKSFQVVELHLTNTTEELELLICTTLSSDITLFEKISISAYRLRSNPLTDKGAGDYPSDSENSGSVDGACGDSITNSSDESELDSARSSLCIVKHKQQCTKKNMLIEYTEIDESESGELWVLALMEGEYSELSLEEKLNSLVALVDLMSDGSSIRTETPKSFTEKDIATIQHHGGAKIKRSSAKQNNMPKPDWGNIANMNVAKEMHTTPELDQVESSEPLKHRMKWNDFTKKGDFCGPDHSKTNGSQAEEVELDGHPLQSIYLGSDRRFNSYWLFLGPCNAKDPGHRRIYFESSEDGHWEVIDTKEALCSLLSVLDGRGSREACLLAALTRLVAFLCEAMSTTMTNDNDMKQSGQSDQSSIDIVSGDGSSPISDVDNNLSLIETVNESVPSSQAIVLELRKVEEQKEKWDRLQAFDAWIWNSFYANLNAVKHSKRSYLDSLVRCASCHDLYWRDEKHCKICHTTFELDFDLEERYAIHVATCREKDSNMFPKHKVLSTQLQSLKAALHAIEGAMPKEALVGAWTTSDHKLWVTRLRRTSSLSELLQVLTDFVGAINEEWLYQCNVDLNCDRAVDEIVESFPTIPQTTSAVALWLGKLDALIAPHSTRVHSEQAEGRTTKQKRKLAHC